MRLRTLHGWPINFHSYGARAFVRRAAYKRWQQQMRYRVLTGRRVKEGTPPAGWRLWRFVE